MDNWTQIPDDNIIEKTAEALKKNGIDAFVVETREEAKQKVLELIPKESEVFTMTSATLDEAGVAKEINESGNYNSVRNKLNSMNRETQGKEMQKLGATPDYAVASVHALTTDGKAMIASNTGSQLAAEVYGSNHVIWVVGAQKIVNDLDEGFSRIYEFVLPLESERLKKLYNVPSFVSKVLIINREVKPNRIQAIIVKEALGF